MSGVARRARRSRPRVIVVDNGSGDGSAERLAAVPGVELIVNESNVGFAAGNNVAIERLLDDGVEFVWVLNNDTVVEPATLASAARASPTPTRASAPSVRCSTTWMHPTACYVGRWSRRAMDRADPGRRATRRDRVDYLTAASVLLRASALRQVGLFDARYFFTWEDVDLCTRLVAGGWRLAVAEPLPGLASVGRNPRAAGARAPRTPRHRARRVPAPPHVGSVADDDADAGVLRGHRRCVSVDCALWTAAWRGWRKGWRR